MNHCTGVGGHRITLPQGHSQVGLVSEWKWGGTNPVKASNCVMERTESVGERSRSGGGQEAAPQQKGVVTVEIRNDFERDIGISWLPVFPLPFSSVQFTVAVVTADLAVAREGFSETFQRAEDWEVGEEPVCWRIAGRSQRNVTENRW